MPLSQPPLGAVAPTGADGSVGADALGLDSGWSSLPPAPTTNEVPSGTQRLPSNRRAEGTLLGVAPPRSPDAPPSRANPVVVHSGLVPPDEHAAPPPSESG